MRNATQKGVAVLTEVKDLRGFKIFDELDDRELEIIAKIAKTEELGKGAVLTQAGKAASQLYLVVKGSVTIMTPGPGDKEMRVDEVGPGQIVGWSTLTGPYIYTATTMTAESSTLIVIGGSKLREIFEVNNHIGYRVLKGIGHVVARRMAAIEAKCAVGNGQR
jgi:CRP/FNR family transcriptional regulator, cyclic AMP receptor protein